MDPIEDDLITETIPDPLTPPPTGGGGGGGPEPIPLQLIRTASGLGSLWSVTETELGYLNAGAKIFAYVPGQSLPGLYLTVLVPADDDPTRGIDQTITGMEVATMMDGPAADVVKMASYGRTVIDGEVYVQISTDTAGQYRHAASWLMSTVDYATYLVDSAAVASWLAACAIADQQQCLRPDRPVVSEPADDVLNVLFVLNFYGVVIPDPGP